MQIKTILRFYPTHNRMAKIKTPVIAHAREDVDQREYSSFSGRSTKLNSHFAYQYGDFSENWECIYFKTQLCYSWSYAQRMLHHPTRTLYLCL